MPLKSIPDEEKRREYINLVAGLFEEAKMREARGNKFQYFD